jgi:hypothetical protein
MIPEEKKVFVFVEIVVSLDVESIEGRDSCVIEEFADGVVQESLLEVVDFHHQNSIRIQRLLVIVVGLVFCMESNGLFVFV